MVDKGKTASDDFKALLIEASDLIHEYEATGDAEPLVEFVNRDNETRAQLAALSLSS